MSENSVNRDLFSEQEIQKEVIEEINKPVESNQKKESPLKLKRRFTEPDINPLNDIEYEKRTARITETNGEVVFELKNLEVPKSWSQLATDILASKYCRRAGVPETEHENSIKQVVHRISNTIRTYGEDNNYFHSKNHLYIDI